MEGFLADDQDRDIAVIKVSGKNLPVLTMADSDSLAVGDHVVAIGSPLGLENSVSDGIISGFREDSKGRSWVQTTAPASHGNSGGPLLTMDDKVAGVVTWKATAGENLNFAVPSKLIAGLLTNSIVKPFGTVSKADAPATSSAEEKIWTSIGTGHDYKVRVDGDYGYIQWVNLPPALQSTTAFIRGELRKTGDKWIGKNVSHVPYSSKSGSKWCRMETDFEIDKLSDSRIEGVAMAWPSFNVGKCQAERLEKRPFVWIPK